MSDKNIVTRKRNLMLKRIVLAMLVTLITAIGVAAYLWNLPHKKVEDATAMNISAAALSKAYNADEKAANSRYLNKAIEVTGTISEIDTNQDGGIMLVLATDDPMAGVQCAMRDKGTSSAKGQSITIIGFCSGNGITGVALTGCVKK